MKIIKCIFGPRWSLYLVINNQRKYELQNNSVIGLIGYVQPFFLREQRIKERCSIYLYCHKTKKGFFISPDLFDEKKEIGISHKFMTKIYETDPNWIQQSSTFKAYNLVTKEKIAISYNWQKYLKELTKNLHYPSHQETFLDNLNSIFISNQPLLRLVRVKKN